MISLSNVFRDSKNEFLVYGYEENIEKKAADATLLEDFPRARLKNHSRHLHAPLCAIFAPNSGYIARYAPFIWHKSPTNCDAHLTESIFQTRSSEPYTIVVEEWEIIKPIYRDYTYSSHLRVVYPKGYFDAYDLEHEDYKIQSQ